MFLSFFGPNEKSRRSKIGIPVFTRGLCIRVMHFIAATVFANTSTAVAESSNPSVFCQRADIYSGLLGSTDVQLGETFQFSAESYKHLSAATRELDSLMVNEYAVLDGYGNSTSTLIETVKCARDYEVIVGIKASSPQDLSSLLLENPQGRPLAADWIEAEGSVLQNIAPNNAVKQSSTSRLIELRILKAELSIDCPSCIYLRQYIIRTCFLSTKANDRCGLLLSTAYSVVSEQ